MITNHFDQWRVLLGTDIRRPDTVSSDNKGFIFKWKCPRGLVTCRAYEKGFKKWTIATSVSTTRITAEVAQLHIDEAN